MKTGFSTQPPGALVFLHIPKTGGRTLSQVILRQYDPGSVFTIGLPVDKSIREFKNLPENRRAQIRLLEGHMPFGLHTYLPHPSTYFSFMRDPVDRVVSIYYYIVSTPQHYLHERLTARKMSFEDFINAGMTTEVDNGQTRLLSGEGFSLPYGECTSELLDAARRNIESNFCLVGITERFDQALLVLRRIFSWRNAYYVKKNVAKNRPMRSAISAESIRAIEANHELDLQLYDWVKRRFDERADVLSQSFQKELQLFRLVNRLFMFAYSPSLQPARNLVR